MAEIEGTWASRELPILRAALRRLDCGEDSPHLDEIRQEAGLTPAQLYTGLKALMDAYPPYIDVQLTGGWTEERANGIVRGVSERARRELGSWPSASTLVDELADALARAAAEEPEPERKGRLEAAADGLRGMARDIAVAVISKQLGDLESTSVGAVAALDSSREVPVALLSPGSAGSGCSKTAGRRANIGSSTDVAARRHL